MTATLEGGEWSAARSGRTLPPGKTPYPFYIKLGGPQGGSGQVENLAPTGIRSRTVQRVVSRYTFWAIRMPSLYDMQIPNFLRNIVLSSVVCPALPYLPPLPQKGTIKRNMKLLTIKCVLIPPTGFILNTSHYKKSLARCKCSWVFM